MKKMIILEDKAIRKKIADELGYTSQALGLALHFKRNSQKAKIARKMAIENGGVLMEELPTTIKITKRLM